MKYYIFLLLLLTPFASAMQISEVYYDPINTETGGEAVELFNPSDLTVDISGWVLMTESSSTDVTVPLNTLVPPRTYFLIADVGWETLKDDSTWPNADHEEPITLSNTDSGVALVDQDQNIVDAVGWGDPAGIDPLLYELSPATTSGEGMSLQRQDDTGDNLFDFLVLTPGLKNSSFASGSSIFLGVEVTASVCTLQLASILDEDSNIGNQVLPFPGATKQIPLTVTALESDLTIQADFAGQIFPLTNNGTEYSASLELEYFRSPGIYTVNLTASSPTTECNLLVDLEYFSMTAVSVDTSDLQFGQITKGSQAELLGDYDSQTSSPTIKNIGNTLLDLGVYADDLVSGSNTLDISNVFFSLDNDFGSSLSAPLSNNINVMDTNLLPAESLPLGLQLNIPIDAPEGIFSGELFITAVGE